MSKPLTTADVVAMLLDFYHQHDPSPALDYRRNMERAEWQAKTLAGWRAPARHQDRFVAAYKEVVMLIDAERAK